MRRRFIETLASVDWVLHLSRFAERSVGVVLSYHAIDSMNRYAGDPPVMLDDFRGQLSLLKARHPFGRLKELTDPTTPSPKRVVLTFDDGDRSFVDKALPVLVHHTAPATVFVCSRLLGTGDFISRETLRDLGKLPGIEIGNHTRSHADLGAEQSRASLEREIIGGRKDLEDLLGREVTSFSYPYGRVSDPSIAFVRASHARAVTAAHGVVWPHTDPITLPRVGATGRPLSLFAFDITDVKQGLSRHLQSKAYKRLRWLVPRERAVS